MSADGLPAVYRAGNDVVTDAYKVGLAEGRRLGYEEEARDHHKWLMNHDERLALVDVQARRMALLDAADAWESGDRDAMHALAEKHYIAGGPSMPTIWLRLRADEQKATSTSSTSDTTTTEGHES